MCFWKVSRSVKLEKQVVSDLLVIREWHSKFYESYSTTHRKKKFIYFFFSDNGYYLYGESDSQLNLSRPLEAPTGMPEDEDQTLMDDVAAQILHICFHIG